jgi:hypothetical protein
MSLRTSALGLAIILLCVPHAHAHALRADARVGKDKVTVKAFFDDDTPAAQALVRIFDSGKKIVAEGRTNSKGFWSCPLLPAGEYQVSVDAGAGHRASKELSIPAGKRDASTAAPDAPPQTDTRAGGDSQRWLKAAIGLSVIAALSIGYLVARRLMPRGPTPLDWNAPETSPK